MKVENTTRAPITLPVVDKDGKAVKKGEKPVDITFGASIDRGVVGAVQPLQDVPSDDWKHIKALPPVKALLERGDLRELGA
jgi:hypothetical protein